MVFGMRGLLPVSFTLASVWQAEAVTGKMTMWSLKSDVIIGSNIASEGGPSSCNFADPKNGGLQSPAAISPYIKSTRYCAADVNTLYAGGKACGKCYEISFDGTGGTDGGRAGKTVIQVINSGTMHHGAVFDCQIDAFTEITGAKTGVYPISYKEVPCTTTDGGAVAMQIKPSNSYYANMVFANMVAPATSVNFVLNGKEYPLTMETSTGTWEGTVAPGASPKFVLLHGDGRKTTFACFSSWPVAQSASCRSTDTPEGAAASAAATAAATAAVTAAVTVAPTVTAAAGLSSTIEFFIGGMDYNLLNSQMMLLVPAAVKSGMAESQTIAASNVPSVTLQPGSVVAIVTVNGIALVQLRAQQQALANAVLAQLRVVPNINGVLNGPLTVEFRDPNQPAVVQPLPVQPVLPVLQPQLPVFQPAILGSMPADLNRAQSVHQSGDRPSSGAALMFVYSACATAFAAVALVVNLRRHPVEPSLLSADGMDE